MDTHEIGSSGISSSRLVYGCMRLAGAGSHADRQKGMRALASAVESGYTQFDHADIYANGECERLFGEFLKATPGLRERVLITGKCGIRFAGDPQPDAPARYDFSAGHIERSVEGSLRRLGVEQLDFLLLHRPDYLMQPAEVAKAFDALKAAGKVANFGVSNFRPSQVELLRSVLDMPLHINQVEINLHNIGALEDGTLDQCQRLGLTPQAWCPLASVAYEAWGNTFSDKDSARLHAELDRQADIHASEKWIIALAWLLKHPSGIEPIVGSTTPGRIAAAKRALAIEITREDWYRLLEARNGAPVP